MSNDSLNSARMHLSEAAELAGTMASGFAMKKLTRALNRCNPISVNPHGPQGYAENSFEGGNVGAPAQQPQYSVGSYPDGHAIEANFVPPPPLPVTEYPGDTVPPALPDPCAGMREALARCASPSVYAAGHKPPGPGGGQFTSGSGGSGGKKAAGGSSRANTPSGEKGPEGLDTGLYPVGKVKQSPRERKMAWENQAMAILDQVAPGWEAIANAQAMANDAFANNETPEYFAETIRRMMGGQEGLGQGGSGGYVPPTQNAAAPYCPSFMGKPTGEVAPLAGQPQPLDTYESFTNQPLNTLGDPNRSLNDTLRQLWLRNHLQERTQANQYGSQPSSRLDVTPQKARTILRDGEVHGHPLTDAQRGMFGAVAGRDDNASYSYPKNPDGRIQGPMQAVSEGDFLGGHFGPGIKRMREQLASCRSC